jgi:hypothetical protein
MLLRRLLLVFALAASSVACSTPSSHIMHRPPAQVRGAMSVSKPESGRHGGGPGVHNKRSAAGLVEESLHARGVRFGTDGSVFALFAFVQGEFARIPADQARDGDVIFFDTGTGCGSHAGVVESAEASGRIGFREWRDGSSRHSFVTPKSPLLRRDEQGRVLNTFLRTKHMEDATETPYFAGEMLCAVFRIDPRS